MKDNHNCKEVVRDYMTNYKSKLDLCFKNTQAINKFIWNHCFPKKYRYITVKYFDKHILITINKV